MDELLKDVPLDSIFRTESCSSKSSCLRVCWTFSEYLGSVMDEFQTVGVYFVFAKCLGEQNCGVMLLCSKTKARKHPKFGFHNPRSPLC